MKAPALEVMQAEAMGIRAGSIVWHFPHNGQNPRKRAGLVHSVNKETGTAILITWGPVYEEIKELVDLVDLSPRQYASRGRL